MRSSYTEIGIKCFGKLLAVGLWGIIPIAFSGKLVNAQLATGAQTESSPSESAPAGGYRAQAEQALARGTQITVPLPRLYWHLLEYQSHLDRFADEREKQGKDGSPFRRTIQNRLGFTDAEFEPIRESAMHLQSVLEDINARAMAVVKQDREDYLKGIYSKDNPPPGVQQLKALNQERDDAIAAEITQLNEALGPEDAAQLRSFIENRFSSHVTARVLAPGGQPVSPSAGNSPTQNGGEVKP